VCEETQEYVYVHIYIYIYIIYIDIANSESVEYIK